MGTDSKLAMPLKPVGIGLAGLVISIGILMLSGCYSKDSRNIQETKPPATSSGPAKVISPTRQPLGDAKQGKEVFRFATFGNEGFWHDAMRWQQGVIESKVTPKQMLQMGLQFDVDAMPASLRTQLEQEFQSGPSLDSAPLLNDPKTTLALLNANAVIGVVAKDTDNDKTIDIEKGDKAGLSCALCHTVTDKSVFNLPTGGTVGRRIDGPAPLTFDMGRFLSLAKNSRAYYLNLQQNHMGIVSIGRASRGLGPDSSEEEVDAYLTNHDFYPVGTFDETHDGIGNPVKNVPLFRQDLAAPYGSAGEFDKFEDITSASYTMNLDMTGVATPEGREFLQQRGGLVGVEVFNEYKKILDETGVTNYPFVDAKVVGRGGEVHAPVGRQVDLKQIRDLTAYVFALPAPRGAKVDREVIKKGQAMFAKQCTSCHNVDQSKPVPSRLVDLKTLWPGYRPLLAGKRGDSKQSTILNALGNFDDKMVLADASWRGDPPMPRGNALPLLLDLDRTTLFLHDASVTSLDQLLDPTRGESAPHPFYIADLKQRADMVGFLQSLDTEPADQKGVVSQQ